MTQDDITQLEQALGIATSNQTTDGVLVGALTIAVSLAKNGYQSDQTAIAAAVASQVGDIQTANATLTAQVADLTAQLATANGTITSMTDILAGLGYNPDGTPIA